MTTRKPLYLEDIVIGDRFKTGCLTVTEEEIKAFAAQYDPQPFHLDDQTAKQTLFKGLAASGWHTAALMVRLCVTEGMPIANGLIGAGVELNWPQPTRPGDTLHVESEVLDIHPSRSKPDRGIVTLRSDTINQNGEIVLQVVSKIVVFRRAGSNAQ